MTSAMDRVPMRPAEVDNVLLPAVRVVSIRFRRVMVFITHLQRRRFASDRYGRSQVNSIQKR